MISKRFLDSLLKLFCVIIFLASGAYAKEESARDEKMKQLDDSIIFENEVKSPIGNAVRVAEKSTGSGESYKIRRGDCLWDLSEEFYRSPWRWREIWSANPYIKDPDLIYPHDKLVIPGIAGSEEPVSSAPVGETYAAREAVVEEPAPAGESSWHAEEEYEYEKEVPVELSGTVVHDDVEKYIGNDFVAPLDWEYDGYIIDSAEKKLMISAGDIVFVDIGSQDGVSPRMRCGVYRLGKKIRSKTNKQYVGRVIRKIAIIETTNEIEDKASTARVINSCDYIKKGDYVRILSKK